MVYSHDWCWTALVMSCDLFYCAVFWSFQAEAKRCSEWRRVVAIPICAPRGRRRCAWVVGLAQFYGHCTGKQIGFSPGGCMGRISGGVFALGLSSRTLDTARHECLFLFRGV